MKQMMIRVVLGVVVLGFAVEAHATRNSMCHGCVPSSGSTYVCQEYPCPSDGANGGCAGVTCGPNGSSGNAMVKPAKKLPVTRGK
jgi:hypothetical protein